MNELQIDERHGYESMAKEQKNEIAALGRELDDRQFAWRPDEKSWSISEHVAHLSITNRKYLDALFAAMEDARAKGLLSPGPYRHGWVGRLFVRSLGPKPLIKVKTFAALQPPRSPAKAEVIADFVTLQDELMTAVERASGIDLGRSRMRSPFLRHLTISLGQGFAAVLAHNSRHLWHIGRLKSHPAFPQAS